MQIARIQLAAAENVTRRAHAETEIRFVGPVHLIVAAAPAWLGEAGDLIMLEAGRLQHIDGQSVQRSVRRPRRAVEPGRADGVSTAACPSRRSVRRSRDDRAPGPEARSRSARHCFSVCPGTAKIRSSETLSMRRRTALDGAGDFLGIVARVPERASRSAWNDCAPRLTRLTP